MQIQHSFSNALYINLPQMREFFGGRNTGVPGEKPWKHTRDQHDAARTFSTNNIAEKNICGNKFA